MNRADWAISHGLAAVIMIVSGIMANAHDDASWIMNNEGLRKGQSYTDYTEAKTHCCGVSDCHRLSKEEAKLYVTENETYITINHPRFGKRSFARISGEPGLYFSIDGDWWVCSRNGDPKCLFKAGEQKI